LLYSISIGAIESPDLLLFIILYNNTIITHYHHTNNNPYVFIFTYAGPFITSFLRLGQEERDRLRLAQLSKQRRLDDLAAKEHKQKMENIQSNSNSFKINYDFNTADLETAQCTFIMMFTMMFVMVFVMMFVMMFG